MFSDWSLLIRRAPAARHAYESRATGAALQAAVRHPRAIDHKARAEYMPFATASASATATAHVSKRNTAEITPPKTRTRAAHHTTTPSTRVGTSDTCASASATCKYSPCGRSASTRGVRRDRRS